MHNRIDIENTRNRAIVREIGERLYVSEAVRVAEPEPEPPTRLEKKIDQHRELEEWSPSIVPSAEH